MQIKFAKFFALMLAAMMVFCVVAGCQPQNPTGGDQQTNAPTTDTPSDPNAGTDTPSDPNAGTDPVAPNYVVDENGAIVHQDYTSVYKKIGSKIAERALAKGIEEVVFDRGGYIYHGRVKALAEAAREGGLKF